MTAETTPMWMVHAACGHCPTTYNDMAPAGERCHDGCHPGLACRPVHTVAVSAKPHTGAGSEYRPFCPSCRRNYTGSWRSHRCDTGGAA